MGDEALKGARGDGSTVASDGGTPATGPGGQPPAKTGSAVEDQLAEARAEIASMRADHAKLTNDFQALNRRLRDGKLAPGTSPDPATPPAAPTLEPVDPVRAAEQLPKDAPGRDLLLQLARESEARRKSDAAAAEQAKKDRAKKRLKDLLDERDPPRREILEEQLDGKVREAADGSIIFDNGQRIAPIEEEVENRLKNELFTPKPIVPGSGTPQGLPPRHGGAKTPKDIELEAAAKIQNPEVRYRKQQEIHAKYGGA